MANFHQNFGGTAVTALGFLQSSAFESKAAALLHQSQAIVYESDDGAVVGTHQGAHFFTKGQRKGLAVGGTKAPLFVIETDVNKNIIYGFGHQHIGWTLGAVTGKIINSICNERVPNINIEPFSPSRFN